MTERRFELVLRDGFPCDVRSARVHEALNEPFGIIAEVLSPEADPDLDGIVGGDASFHVLGVQGCGWTGVVSEIAELRAAPGGLSTYEIHLRPALWLLSQRTNHRMFHAMSEPAAALALLSAWGIEPDVRFDPAHYKAREVCVQYDESDLAFVSRMFERAGIAYWFELQRGQSRLVLADAPQAAPPTRLPYDGAPRPGRAVVYGLRAARELRPSTYSIRDVDFRKSPRTQPSDSVVADDACELERTLGVTQYTPGAFLFEAPSKADPVGDDRIAVRTDSLATRSRVANRMAAKRQEARSFSFSTTDASVGPGRVVLADGHPDPPLGADGPLLVVATVLEVLGGEGLVRRADAVRATLPYRPKLVAPRPRVSGIQTATVVGPAGDEIPTDEFGRIRVHFHWDRESERDERSSTWLHVSSPWAGAGFGAIKPPRAGQEVIVSFAGGDPDRPLVTGRVHTALQPVPYSLPANKTQSGWKTSSTGGSGGFNELMFEDKAGAEVVRMRAERDLSTRVLRDERRTVGGNRSTQIGRDETRTVGGNRERTVEGDNRKVVFGSSDNLTSGFFSSAVTSSYTNTNGESNVEVVGGSRIEHVAGDSKHEAPENDESAGVWLKIHVASPKGGVGTGVFVSADEVSAFCGGSSFALKGPHCTVRSENVIFRSNSLTSNYGGEGSVTGRQVVFEASSKAQIRGAPIHLQQGGLGAGRLGDAAPATVDEGASKVKVGGPSLPSDIVAYGPGWVRFANGIEVDGRRGMSDGGKDSNGKELPDIEWNNSPEDASVFVGKTLANLARMGDTPSGKKLLDELAASKKRVKIRPTNDMNGYAKPTDDTNAVNGKGSDVTISYNPDYEFGPKELGDRDLAKTPSSVMFHELTHGKHMVQGTADPTRRGDGYENMEEYNTITGDKNNEGEYLKDLGIYWHREDHDGGWKPN